MRRTRGAALIMAVFFMTMLFGVGLAFIRLIPGEYFAAQRLQTDTAGYYVADAGVSMCLAWLESIGSTGVATNLNNDWTASFSNTYPSLVSDSPNPILGGIRNWTSNPTPGSSPAPSPGGTWSVAPASVRGAMPNGWQFDAQITRWNYRISNPTDDDLKGTYFMIVSEAKRGKDTYRRVRCWARPGNFADDAYAVDVLPSDIWLNLQTFKLTGPYRTNGRCLLYTPNNFWPATSGSPRPAAINGSVTFYKGVANANLKTHPGTNSVLDGVTYSDHGDQDRMPYNINTGAEYSQRYNEITTNGRNGISYSDSRQDMPENTEALGDVALGTPAPSPSLALGASNSTAVFPSASPGLGTVNLHATTNSTGLYNKGLVGGLYFEGSVDNVTLSAPSSTDGNGDNSDGNLNSFMTVKQGTRSVNITQVYESFTLPVGAKINGAAATTSTQTISASTNNKGYTVIQDGTDNKVFKVFDGTGNGAIYFTGDVNAVSGVNRGRKTLATRTGPSMDKKITINGNLTRADTTPGQNVTGVRDQLGFLTYKVVIADNSKLMKNDGTAATRASTTQANPLYIYGAFVLGRDGDPHPTSSTLGGGMGSANHDDDGQGEGFFKLFGSLTEGVRQVKGVIGQSGNGYQYNYDTNMSTLPPPFFPAKSRFRIDAWNEEAVFNY